MSNEVWRYEYWEHRLAGLEKSLFADGQRPVSKLFGLSNNRHCYQVTEQPSSYTLQAGYYVGVDWLVKGHSVITVSPKLNTGRAAAEKEKEANPEIELQDTVSTMAVEEEPVAVDYPAMLRQCLDTDYLYAEIDDLVHIDWMAPEISIPQQQDWLSPLLIVKFLNVLKSIVRKGLQKSYYQTTQNLSGKIKGKILVGANIRQNVVKQRFTQTLCRYEQFGIDSVENRLLNKALRFSAAYLDNHKRLFGSTAVHLAEHISFCRPAFDFVGKEVKISEIKSYKPNPFFREYAEGIQLAKLILKRYAYSLSNTAKEEITTPPYWIDMPKLFELYVYAVLKRAYPIKGELLYHTRTHGNELDFLVNSGEKKMVVDAKYKPMYRYGVNHNDMRQVSGYARLEKTYEKLNLEVSPRPLIDCLIVYPDGFLGRGETAVVDQDEFEKVKGYVGIHKVSVKLPKQ